MEEASTRELELVEGERLVALEQLSKHPSPSTPHASVGHWCVYCNRSALLCPSLFFTCPLIAGLWWAFSTISLDFLTFCSFSNPGQKLGRREEEDRGAYLISLALPTDFGASSKPTGPDVALKTSLCQIQPPGSGLWHLTASVPDYLKSWAPGGDLQVNRNLSFLFNPSCFSIL